MTTPLVSAAELRGLLGQVTLLDVRYRMGGPPGLEAYAKGHLPGAVHVDLDAELAGPPGKGGRHPLPDPMTFQAAMRRAGVRDDRPVVAYDDWSAHAAGRAWWLLRFFGHADVRVLDGGLAAWDGDLETGPVVATPGDFTARPGHRHVVEAHQLRGIDVLVDARAGERYRGEAEPVDRVAGHIPGAVNVPTAANLRQDGTFRSADELRVLYAEVGVTAESDVAVYCGSGVTAGVDLLALELAGISAALYPGGWSGWITDPTRPVSVSP